MSNPPKTGTARWHLGEAATWLIAARAIFDNETPMADKATSIAAMAALAQAHATLGAAIEAHPTIEAAWARPE